MAFSVQMPALGESVTEGTVTRWLKQEGDTVELDEPLVEVSTDKVDTEIPSPAAGVLTKIIAQEDDTVEVGGDLALIGESAETVKLSFNLNGAGFTADNIDTKSTITFENGAIVESHLEVTASIPGIDQAKFDELVADAEKNCPISKLLNTKITVEAKLA